MTDKEVQKPVRVLHILVTLNLGGAESRMMDLYRNQDRTVLTHDFAIMTDETCHFTDEVILTGGVIHVLTNPRKSLIKHITDLYQLLKRVPKYDAIHAHTSFHAGLCLMIAFFAGTRARVSHARNVSTSTPSAFTSFMLFAGRSLINVFATKRFAISKAAGQYLYGDAEFTVVPNAFNYQSISHKEDLIDDKTQVLGIDGGVHIVAVARFYPVKNHHFMIDILKAMADQRDDVYLHLIGDGELKEDIETKVDGLGLSEHVRFWGKRNDVYQLLPYFDAMLMPSFTEGLGVAALEAQKAGLPCLVSDSLPEEVDIALGLCKRLSLDEPASVWAEQCLSLLDIPVPSKSVLDEKFSARGFSLSFSEQQFYKAYRCDG